MSELISFISFFIEILIRANHRGEVVEEKTAPRAQVEEGVIRIFVSIVQKLGLPRSLGEIYGLLYISPEPLTMDAIRQRLGISLGSASQGLKTLKTIRAVRPIYQPGDRSAYFEAETEFRRLIGGFYREQILPELEEIDQHLRLMEPHLAEMAGDPAVSHYQQRLSKLVHVRRRSETVLRRIMQIAQIFGRK